MTAREAKPTGKYVTLTTEEVKVRKRRGRWLALGLFGFVLIVFAVSIARMGGSIYNVAESRRWSQTPK